ncbi:type II toxin-antitoxin system VapC family toxin [Jiangella gansuensis]|uniref:type II toxin-antitoxin system VapC family toxin n=1 Tax=Jiangella gansuensis TaxID=281473 RepID=UPI00047967C2|nr:type II toxin-antitoxin system VapC family toxin [Jiangella gansuensis]
MIVVDTTVLVYAVGTEHPYREPCRSLVQAVRDGRVRATTTVEVVQEFTHVRARRRGREDAASLALDVVDTFSPLLRVDENDLRTGIAIYRSSGRLGSFEAILAATAVNAGADGLVSADKAFGDVAGLRHVVPDIDAVQALIGG